MHDLRHGLATAPLHDLVKGKPHKKRLTKIAESAHVPLWATEDGKSPKDHGGAKARKQPARRSGAGP